MGYSNDPSGLKRSLAAARAEIERLTAELERISRHLKRRTLFCLEVVDRAEKAEAERDEARAQVAEARMATALIEAMSKSPGTTWGQLKAAVRALGDLGDRHALEAYGREKVREGMKRAAELIADEAHVRSEFIQPAAPHAAGVLSRAYDAILAEMEKLK